MMKTSEKKGFFIIYVLFTITLLATFLTAALQNVHNGIFQSAKFFGETKAYWASASGHEYALYRIQQNAAWPFGTPETTEQFGTYTVREKRFGNIAAIHGVSEDEDSEFLIYFSNKKEPKDGYVSIVNSDPEGKSVNYWSFNSITEENVHEYDGNFDDETVEISQTPSNKKTTIVSPGVYIASEGRSGAYRCATAKLLIPDNLSLFSAGVYSGGDMNIRLKGSEAVFSVAQTTSAKADVFCKGTFSINRDQDPEGDASSGYLYPCSVDDGAIYYGTRVDISGDTINAEDQFSSTQHSQIFNFAKKYGVNIEKYNASNKFPAVKWESISESSLNEITNSMPLGTYATLKNVQTGKYDLYYSENYHSYDGTQLVMEIGPNLDQTSMETMLQGNGFYKVPQNSEDYGKIYVDLPKNNNNDTPVIYLKSSVKAEGGSANGLSFIRLETYVDSENMPPSLPGAAANPQTPIITHKIRQSSLPLELKFGQEQEYKERQYDGESLCSILTTKFKHIPSTLYSQAPISISGKLTGDGQILGGESIFFKAGSELNINRNDNQNDDPEYEEETSSQIAIYAKGSVKMGYTASGNKQNLNGLTNKMKSLAAGETGGSLHSIVQSIMRSKVNINDLDIHNAISIENFPTLEKVMTKAYGYSKREAEWIVYKLVEQNYRTKTIKSPHQAQKTTVYYMPNDVSEIIASTKAPSSFSGVIYTCGGFSADMENGPFTLNGILISYGGDPSSTPTPGSGAGISQTSLLGIAPGNIEINNCSNFTVLYDETDLKTFVENYEVPLITNLKQVYFERLP